MFIGDVRRSREAEIGKKVKEERMMKLEMERKKIEEEALVARIEGKKEYGRGRDKKKIEEDREKGKEK